VANEEINDYAKELECLHDKIVLLSKSNTNAFSKRLLLMAITNMRKAKICIEEAFKHS